MPPEQPSGTRWWNRLPGRGGGLHGQGGSQGDLQHGEAPLSAAQQARDRLARYCQALPCHACCAVLCCAVLCCAVLCCAVLKLFDARLHCIALISFHFEAAMRNLPCHACCGQSVDLRHLLIRLFFGCFLHPLDLRQPCRVMHAVRDCLRSKQLAI